MDKKVYKVIKIMDDMNLIVNCGTEHNVEKGDRFYIYSKEMEKIKDPFTDEVLDEFHKIKAEIEAVIVYKKVCICQNAQRTFPSVTSLEMLNRIIGGNERFTLNVDPSQISGGLDIKNDEMIQIGDDVEKIN